VADTIDPLGGSYYVESLTDAIERGAMEYLDRIDRMGGALKALDGGFFHQEIGESAYQYQRRIESGDEVVVGVNRFVEEKAAPIEILRVDPSISARQKDRLRALRQRRDNARVAAALDSLRQTARGTSNLIESIVRCVECYCTLGEISDALRAEFGEYRDPSGV
ncbi:MAG TPA: methylmalonyl-CoA mutase family protein, partial [Chloroflexota bacterium]|nr:methylmalonyl-CoA mutase family protein [Chloroflexota bacterium]